MLLSQRSDLLGQQSLIQTIPPFSKSLSVRHLVSIPQLLLIRIAEGNVKCLLRSLPRTDVDMRQLGGVNQFAITDNDLARREDLLLAVLCEWDLGDARVAAALGPLRLACVC